MQSTSGGALKHSAEVIPGHPNLSGNAAKCHRFIKTRTKNEFDLAHGLTLSYADLSKLEGLPPLCRLHCPLEQGHDRIFDSKNIHRRAFREMPEHPSL
jgi:hypothetical protein